MCVATLLNAGISTISPKGKVKFTSLAKYKDPLVTNIAFGGKDMKTAWITVSGRGLLLKTPWPKPGLVLAFNA